jgi:hypothetical protein
MPDTEINTIGRDPYSAHFSQCYEKHKHKIYS